MGAIKVRLSVPRGGNLRADTKFERQGEGYPIGARWAPRGAKNTRTPPTQRDNARRTKLRIRSAYFWPDVCKKRRAIDPEMRRNRQGEGRGRSLISNHNARNRFQRRRDQPPRRAHRSEAARGRIGTGPIGQGRKPGRSTPQAVLAPAPSRV